MRVFSGSGFLYVLVCLCACAAPVGGTRSASATNLLNRLYEAAKERADHIRDTEGTGPGIPRNKDLLSSLLDYTTEKLQNPPLRSTELNFVTVQRDMEVMIQEFGRLWSEVERLQKWCPLVEQTEIRSSPSAPQESTSSRTERISSALDGLPSQLVPIQATSKTILPK